MTSHYPPSPSATCDAPISNVSLPCNFSPFEGSLYLFFSLSLNSEKYFLGFACLQDVTSIYSNGLSVEILISHHEEQGACHIPFRTRPVGWDFALKVLLGDVALLVISAARCGHLTRIYT